MPEPRVALLADEGFDGRVVRGLRRRSAGIDLVTVQELGRRRDPDELVLQRAAEEGRVVLARDKKTLVPAAWRRVARGEPMPGVIVVPDWYPVRLAIDEIVRLIDADRSRLDGQVVHLPLDKSWRVSEDEPAWAAARV